MAKKVRYTQPLFGEANAAGYLIMVPGASVLIRQNGVACTVYASNAGAAMTNPVPTGVPTGTAGVDVNGTLLVYLDPGSGYDGLATVGSAVSTFPIPDISPDVSDVSTPAAVTAEATARAAADAALSTAVAAKQDTIPPGTYVGPTAPVVAATSSTVVGSAKVTGDATDRFRVQADGTLDFGTPGNLTSRQRLYPTAAGLEADSSLTLRKEVTGGTVAPEFILRSKASDGTFPFWLAGAIDVANTIKGRDLVLAAKGDYPSAGNVSDFVMCPHNGSGPPGFAVGGWPPDAVAMAHFQINAADLTKVTMRVGFVASQTGDLLRVGGASADTFVVRADSGVRVVSSVAEAFSVRSIGGTLNFLVDVTGAGKTLSPAMLHGFGNGFANGGTPANNLDVSVSIGNTASIRARSANGADFQVLVPADLTGTKVGTTLGTPLHLQTANTTRISIGAAGEIGFFAATPVAKPTGVAVTAAGIHAALVSLGLIGA